MKNLLFLLFTALAITVSLPAGGQEQPGLEGEWKSSLALSLSSMNAQERGPYENMSEKAKENMQKNFSERTFRFEKNGTVTVSFIVNNSLQQMEGQWSYPSAQDILSVNMQGEEHIYRVEWVSSREIILHYQQVSPQAILKCLYLTRQ